MKDLIYQKISTELFPEKIEVVDESHLHVGHAGYKAGGETHFKIIIIDQSLFKQPRVEIHRLINKILKTELENQVHALSIEIKSPLL